MSSLFSVILIVVLALVVSALVTGRPVKEMAMLVVEEGKQAWTKVKSLWKASK